MIGGVQIANPGWWGLAAGLALIVLGVALLVVRVRRQRRWRRDAAAQGSVRAAFQAVPGRWHPCDGPQRGFAVGRARVPRQRDGRRG